MKVSRLARRYVLEHPSVGECLKRGIVNYSALARQICDYYRIDQPDAVSIACRRFSSRLKKRASSEEQILRLAAGIKVNVSLQMALIRLATLPSNAMLSSLQQELAQRSIEFDLFFSGSEAKFLINSRCLSSLENCLRGVKTQTRLATIQIDFSGSTIEQRSASALLLNRLVAAGIPITDFFTGRNNIKILLEEQQVSRSLELLQSVIVRTKPEDEEKERAVA